MKVDGQPPQETEGPHRVLSAHLDRVVQRGQAKAESRGRYIDAERDQNLDDLLRDLGGEGG